jgi:hypothetical protein
LPWRVELAHTAGEGMKQQLFSASKDQCHSRVRGVGNRATPNPSIERTSTGWPGPAGGKAYAWPGQPVPAAHVKR